MDLLQGVLANFSEHSSRVSDNDEDKEIMNRSLSNVHNNGVEPPQESEIHEAKAVHQKVYQEGAAASDEDLGKAAGVEAFHSYEKAEESGSSGGGQGQLIQMAMAEAMKMFSSGGGSDKGAVIQSAIAMATKLFMGKSGAGGGGVAQLMSMFGGKGGEGGSSGLAGLMSNPQVAGMLENPAVSGMFKKFM
ncbi:hypothetical protein BGZ83_003983 [Gryganskiella cystojenkinii]|nr:hypothetical protein BGZ83_003983 [Gryganskiella cystojenkinii]